MEDKKRTIFSIDKEDVRDITGEDLYLRRWNMYLPFRWSIKVHKIVRNDDDRCQHDHPWIFIRIILWGGYVEERGGKRVVLKPWRPWAFWRIYPALGKFKHRIDRLLRPVSWSLIICGPKKMEWGFYTKGGWMHWQEFASQAKGKRIMWCEDGRSLNEETETTNG